MALTQIKSDGIANAAITTQQLAPGAAGGPKITQIQITDSGGTVLDDTAISLSGGYIKITGTGFAAGAQVIVNNTPATSTTFTSTTVLNAQVGAQSAGTYVVYVVNTDGGVAIAVNGLTYSDTPTWVTSSTLDNQLTDVPISIQLSATGANTYSLDAGSSLPDGLTLSSGGLLSGTVSILAETTYSFTVNAIDTELQDSPRTFSLTVNIVIPDPYFYLTTLLLPGNGTNNGTNNTFLDSSTNNYTITRAGNAIQGTFSPFSLTGWSNFFDGSGDYLSVADNAALDMGSGSFTIEGWYYPIGSASSSTAILAKRANSSTVGGVLLYYGGSGLTPSLLVDIGGSWAINQSSSVSFVANQWNHFAIVRNGSAFNLYINGVSGVSATNAGTIPDNAAAFTIGAMGADGSGAISSCHISNFRVVKGTAVYTGAFTPPTSPLTAIANTSLLTCQNNRFIDNSTNNFTITVNGNTSIQSFSPFNPTTAYSTSTVGGSAYFDGSGDYLSWSGSTIGSQSYTAELWFYANNLSGIRATFGTTVIGGFNLRIASSTSISIDAYNNSAQSFTVPTMTTGQWYHLVAVRNASNQTTVFLNGVRSSTGVVSISTNYGAISKLGQSAELTDYNGYISGARLVIGSAVYDPTVSTISVPTTPPTAVTNTNLLLSFTNGQITDATSKTVLETVGDAKISTAASKWAGSSMYFDGTGDYLLPINQTLLTLGTGAFTIEFWFNTTSSTQYAQFIGNESSGGGGFSILINDTNSTSGDISVYNGASGKINNTTGTSYRDGAWHFLAFTRDSNGSRLFIDGVQQGSTNAGQASTSFDSSPARLVIGNNLQYSPRAYLGYLQDIRITRGYARYTSNFSVPTAAFPVQ